MPRYFYFALLAVSLAVLPARAQSPPKDLPRYDVNVVLDPAERHVRVAQVATWTNTSSQAVRDVVFNAHARYSIPDEDVGLLAKTVEVLRMSPKEALSFNGPADDR